MTRRDIALVLFVVIVWANNFVAVKVGVEEMPAFLLLALRFSLTSIVFLPFLRWPGREKARLIFEITLLMSIMNQGLAFVGLTFVTASAGIILMQAQVIFSVFLAWFFLKEHIGWRTCAGIVIGLVGITITVGSPGLDNNLMACGLILISTLFVSLSYFRMKHLQDIHPATYIALLNLFAVPFMWALYFVTHAMGYYPSFEWAAIDWNNAGISLAYQVLFVSVGHIVWQQLIARNAISKVTPYTLLMPIVGVGSAAVILQEVITMAMIIGGLITMLGITIITYRRIQKGVEPHPETE